MRSGEIKAQCPLNLLPFIALLPRSLFHSWSGTRVLVLSLASTLNWSSLPQCPPTLPRPPIIFSFHCFIFGSQAGLAVPSTQWQGQHTSTSPSAQFPLQHPLSRVIVEVTRRSRLVPLHFPNWVHCPVDPALRKVRRTPILLGSVPSSSSPSPPPAPALLPRKCCPFFSLAVPSQPSQCSSSWCLLMNVSLCLLPSSLLLPNQQTPK